MAAQNKVGVVDGVMAGLALHASASWLPTSFLDLFEFLLRSSLHANTLQVRTDGGQPVGLCASLRYSSIHSRLMLVAAAEYRDSECMLRA